jgi:hypothetical protein
VAIQKEARHFMKEKKNPQQVKPWLDFISSFLPFSDNVVTRVVGGRKLTEVDYGNLPSLTLSGVRWFGCQGGLVRWCSTCMQGNFRRLHCGQSSTIVTSAPWQMDDRTWMGNTFPLGFSSVAKHSGYLGFLWALTFWMTKGI